MSKLGYVSKKEARGAGLKGWGRILDLADLGEKALIKVRTQCAL